jgi:polyphosphate kinase
MSWEGWESMSNSVLLGMSAPARSCRASISTIPCCPPRSPPRRSGAAAYDKRMKRKEYREQVEPLQVELVKLKRWVERKSQRIVIIFEGRDAAGKGGTINKFTQHLNPRHARAVALAKPDEVERGQWYFQRYVEHLPSIGNMILFDRSWYNRAGVERVMGFCTDAQAALFLVEAPNSRRALFATVSSSSSSG